MANPSVSVVIPLFNTGAGRPLAFLDADTGRQQPQARADCARVLKQMIGRRRAQMPGKTP
jgi:hypothetical protein